MSPLWADPKASSTLSTRALSKHAVEYLRRDGTERHYPAGSVIVQRTETHRPFYVILKGQVEVRYTSDDGLVLRLSRLGPRSTFGETALLRKHFEASEVIAITDVDVLVYPAEKFHQAVEENEELQTYLLSQLAGNLHHMRSLAWRFYRRTKALDRLVMSDYTKEPIIAFSRRMRALEQRIPEVAQNARPLLISGEEGTGKFFIAKKVYEAMGNPQMPFLVVDCSKLEEGNGHHILFGTGAHADSFHAAFGAVHLAEGGVLVLRNIDALDRQSQEQLSRYLSEMTSRTSRFAPRIIATTQEKIQELVQSEKFPATLAMIFSGNVLQVPALGERRSDILPLARHILSSRRGRDASGELTPEAEALLFSLRFQHKNVTELKETINLADFLSEGGMIRPEHLSAGPADERMLEFDLFRFRWVRWLISPRTLSVLRYLTLAVFLGVVGLTLFFPDTPAGETANRLIWSFWEPALVVAFLLSGRLWCTICPLSTADNVLQRLGSLGRAAPAFIRKYGIFFAIIGLVAIIWSEHAFHMTEKPFGSGLLLLALLAGAVIFGLIYQRQHVWCRYICPLGVWGAAFSATSFLQLRANPSVCSTRCTTQDCYKGNKEQTGCPTFHHPLYTSDGYACKLCFKCISLCPYDSPRLYIRPLLRGLWGLGSLNGVLIPFNLSLFAFSLAMLASWHGRWLSTPLGLAVGAAVAVAAAYLFQRTLPHLLSAETERDPSITARIAFAFLVLAWGPLFAYQIENIPILPSLTVHAIEGSPWGAYLPDPGISFLGLTQALIILFAASLSFVCFVEIRARLTRLGVELSRRAWKLFALIFSVYIVLALLIVVMHEIRHPG